MFKYLNKLSFLLAATCLIIGLTYLGSASDSIAGDTESDTSVSSGDEGNSVQETADQGEQEQGITVPPSTAGLLIGLDKSGGLTDVLMVGYLDTVKNEVKIVSVPRDLTIDFREPYFKDIKANNPDNNILYCKLTEYYYLTGKTEQSLQDIRSIIEIITGLDIQYMMAININGFKDVVDAVGGIDFDVPQNMKYDDPVQDLHIHLKAGMQHLDGDKAEQLVRFRKYQMGDLQRIQVQQQVLTAIFQKVMTIDSFDQWLALSTSIFNMFEADFGLLTVMQYAEYVFGLDYETLVSPDNMTTIPSWGELVDERWFQKWDIDEANAVVKELIEN